MIARLLRSKTYLLTYKYVPGMAEKRTPFRQQHLDHAKDFQEKGKLLLGGALQNPIDTGLLIFEGEENEIKNYAQTDPYTVNGLVTEFSVREIALAFGTLKPK